MCSTRLEVCAVGMRETVYAVITTNSNLATFPGQIHRVRNHIILALASFPDPGHEGLTWESGYLGTSFIPRPKGVGCGLGTGYPSNGFIPRPKKYRERSGNEANSIQIIRQCTHSHTQKVTYVLQLQDREQLSVTCGEKMLHIIRDCRVIRYMNTIRQGKQDSQTSGQHRLHS